MWRPEGDEDVDSLVFLNVCTKSSSVIIFVPEIAVVGWARVCRIRRVSGTKLWGRSCGKVPLIRSCAYSESPLCPRSCARWPNPKGVECAWWYCLALMSQITSAISCGLVIAIHGPSQVFGSLGSPKWAWFACLSGISTRPKPLFFVTFSVWPIFLCVHLSFYFWRICLTCSSIHSALIDDIDSNIRLGAWSSTIASASSSRWVTCSSRCFRWHCLRSVYTCWRLWSASSSMVIIAALAAERWPSVKYCLGLAAEMGWFLICFRCRCQYLSDCTVTIILETTYTWMNMFFLLIFQRITLLRWWLDPLTDIIEYV